MTGQSNNSQGRGHDRLPNWNPKNGEMLISQPVTSCLTNHSELCMSRPRNNQSRRISIYTLHRRPFFGFESSVSSTSMTSGDPVVATIYVRYVVVTTDQCRMAYQNARFPMTLSDLKVIHILQAFQMRFFVQCCSSW